MNQSTVSPGPALKSNFLALEEKTTIDETNASEL